MFSAKLFSVLTLLLLAPACRSGRRSIRRDSSRGTVVRTSGAPVARKKIIKHRNERIVREPARLSGPDGWNVAADEM